MMNDHNEIGQEKIDILKEVIKDLVEKNYASIILTKRDGVKSVDIERVVNEYVDISQNEMTVPPEEAFKNPMIFYEWERGGAICSSITINLWFGEVEQDLCAEVYIIEKDGVTDFFLSNIFTP